MVEGRKFITPNERQRKEALGDLKGASSIVKKMIDGAEEYWTPKLPP